MKEPFWKRKTLEELNAKEWESLCDGCGRCCLVKLEDEDTGEVHFTNVACRLFDTETCRCADYKNRAKKVADCIRLTPQQVRTLSWLPPTCGYRLVAEGRDLPWWHPLVSGDPATVAEAGISAHGRVKAMEDDVPFEKLPKHIVQWPRKVPAKAK
ncbi:YcgN family cysteine cluster protein [Methylovirgula sp. 4M-Z18]|uniref:YcgN family cysteine cluster protein n=1 Tax=Methylovirgula sp. 4M-Z18 TaxID=2293567 RepID=UPI0018F57875|nr:YcgN family cysteine cluster protein [Methylovirgula sp. 4M-Z18]